jgi:GTP cyclohydrolase I
MKQDEEIHDDEIGENHIGSCATNPVRDDAFAISDDEKIEKIKRC